MRSRSPFRPLAFLVAALALGGGVRAADPKPGPGSKAADGTVGQANESLEWMEYGKALERARKENKHVLVDFYTNWCGWCKKMDRDTYADSAVSSYLRQHFVLSKINAESPRRFAVRSDSMSGVDLARDFRVNSFPITWFLKPDGSKLDKVSGYVAPDRFIHALVFVHERKYQKAPSR